MQHLYQMTYTNIKNNNNSYFKIEFKKYYKIFPLIGLNTEKYGGVNSNTFIVWKLLIGQNRRFSWGIIRIINVCSLFLTLILMNTKLSQNFSDYFMSDILSVPHNYCSIQLRWLMRKKVANSQTKNHLIVVLQFSILLLLN